MSQDQPTDPRMFWIIWGALLASVAMYGVVTHTLSMSGDPMPDSTLRTVVYALIAASVGCAGAAYWIRQRMFFDRLDDPDFDGAQRAQTLFTTNIITWALCEAVAIYGLTLRILGQEVRLFYPFAVASVALFILFRPRPNKYLEDDGDEEDAEVPDSEAEW